MENLKGCVLQAICAPRRGSLYVHAVHYDAYSCSDDFSVLKLMLIDSVLYRCVLDQKGIRRADNLHRIRKVKSLSLSHFGMLRARALPLMHYR